MGGSWFLCVFFILFCLVSDECFVRFFASHFFPRVRRRMDARIRERLLVVDCRIPNVLNCVREWSTGVVGGG